MDVILLQRVENLGQMGDVVRVKPGYARNYLLPKKKALRATDGNKALFERRRTQLEAENLEHRKEAEQVAKTLDGLAVALIRQAGETGQLYGSVTARDVARAVSEAGFSILRQQVELDHPIKALGIHGVKVRLHPEVSVHVRVNVARSPQEAEIQAKTGMAVIQAGEEAAAGARPAADREAAPEMAEMFEEGRAPGAEDAGAPAEPAAAKAGGESK
jgi:large subunit ribosomal protein L9